MCERGLIAPEAVRVVEVTTPRGYGATAIKPKRLIAQLGLGITDQTSTRLGGSMALPMYSVFD